MLDRAQAETRGETQLVVTRDFRHAPEVLFRALTESALLEKWMLGPPGWRLEVLRNDHEVGGRYHWRWTSEEGQFFGFTGEVRAFDPPHRITATQVYDPGNLGNEMGGECLVDQEVTGAAGGSRLVVTLTFASAEDRAAALATGMTEGMEMSYARIDALEP